MTTVAVLGTGYMGAPMARNILFAGRGNGSGGRYRVRVWNRTRERAEPLGEDGATLADSPADAVDGADIVVTMLADGTAVEQVMRDAAPAMRRGALWLQMSTVGEQWTQTFGDLADKHDVSFFDAPVLGTRKPAEAGELTILAAGSPELRAHAQPIFDVVGSRTIWLDQPGEASRLELVPTPGSCR